MVKQLLQYLIQLIGKPVDPIEVWASSVIITGLNGKPFLLKKRSDGLYDVVYLQGEPQRKMNTLWEAWRVSEVKEGINRAFTFKTLK